MLGADHHGYIARLKASMAALGEDPDRVEMPILQFVHIVEGGARAAMSKRRGDFVTLDELIGEIGVDATRWFMLSRSHDSTIDLDLELARGRSRENPVYYVQYAHARIASVLARRGRSASPRRWPRAARPASRCTPSERELVKQAARASRPRSPRPPTGARRTGSPPTRSSSRQAFTAFYRDCRVVGAEPGAELERSGCALCVGRRSGRSPARSGLLGGPAPETAM